MDLWVITELPRWLRGKESACQCKRRGRCGFGLELGRSPGGGHGNPFQYSCLENSQNRAWQVAVHGVHIFAEQQSKMRHEEPNSRAISIANPEKSRLY